MVFDFKSLWTSFRTGAHGVLRRHPVELLLAAGLSAALVLCYECDWEPDVRLAAVGWGAVLLLAVNLLTGRTLWRRLYWVAWAPLVPLALWPGFGAWLESARGAITVGLLTPLALLACRRAVANRRFVFDTVILLRAALLALLFAYVALGLFQAILWSAAYIFGFGGAAWVEHAAVDTWIVTSTFVVPLLFMMMLDRWERSEVHGTRILEVLLDWIVSPAVLIYAAILYLYAFKILVTWSLPEGGVAYLVFGFTSVALAVKALQELLGRRIYGWFYDRLSLFALPAAVLFWIGTLRRVGEYGLTEPRVYLVVCGAVMTFCLAIFLSHRRAALPPQLSPAEEKARVEMLRRAAKADLPARIGRIAAETGLRYAKLSIRASRTKWGSCSGRNHVSLSLFLMTLPEHLRDYVIVHELCHTVHHDHSPRFHALVDRLVGGREKALSRELRAYAIR